MATSDKYDIKFSGVDKEKTIKLLCDKHDFAQERVEKSISDLAEAASARKQKGLMDFG